MINIIGYVVVLLILLVVLNRWLNFFDFKVEKEEIGKREVKHRNSKSGKKNKIGKKGKDNSFKDILESKNDFDGIDSSN